MMINFRLKTLITCFTFFSLLLFSSDIRSQCDSAAVHLDFPDETIIANPGDVITIPLRVENFREMVIFVFSINFRSTILEYVGSNPLVSGLPSFDASSIVDPFPPDNADVIRVLWSSPNIIGETLADGTVLLELQFRVIGVPGTCGAVLINAAGLNAQISFISDINGNTVENAVCLDGGIDLHGAQVCVEPVPSPTPEGHVTASCGAEVGQNTGIVEISVFNGTGPYTITDNLGMTYDVDPNTNIFIDSLLGIGTKTYTITDANGMTSAPIQAEITTSTPFDIVSELRFPRCPTDDNGRITVCVTGGRPYNGTQYEFDWGPQQFGRKTKQDELLRLPNGNYTVSIRDSLGCTETITYDLTRSEIVLEDLVITDALCDARNNGRISVSASGGGPFSGGRYTFSLDGTTSGGVPYSDTKQEVAVATFNLVPPGDYIITAIDSTGRGTCGDEPQMMITVGTSRQISTSFSATSTGCGLGEESATLTIAATDNLELPVTINITDSTGAVIFNGSNPTDTYTTDCLPQGRYDVRITDSQGCPIDTFFILQGCSLQLTDTTLVNPSCTGINDGSIEVTVSSTNMPSFAWSTGATTPSISDLAAGTYSVTISDQAGCELIDSFSIEAPNPIVINFDPVPIQCPEGIGDIRAATSGGSGTYTFVWNTGDSTATIAGVPTGNYVVTVTDDNGCSLADSFFLAEPESPAGGLSNIQAPDCQGDNSGSAAITILPNADFPGPFFFESSTGQTASGTTIQVTDFPSGSGKTNWVIYSDGVCLFDTVFVVIPDAEPLLIDRDSSVIQHVPCFGGTGIDGGFVNLVGMGGAAITFRWPDLGPNVVGNAQFLDAGTYTVILESGNCSVSEEITINEPPPIAVTLDPTQTVIALCGGDNSSILGISHTGGADSAAFTYNWEDGSGNSISTQATADNLAPGSYFITVTDINGCTGTFDTTITEPPPVVASLGPVRDPLCTGDFGQIYVESVSGGVPGNYRYQVNTIPAISVSDTFDVIPGDYIVRVFDQNGCEYDTSVVVNTPLDFTASAGPDIDIELGGTATLDVSINGPSPVATIDWTPPNFVTCLNNNCQQVEVNPFGSQLFEVMVTDVNGCVALDDILVSVQTTRDVYMPNAFSPNAAITDNAFYSVFAGSGVAVINSMRIFDRWGNMLHEELNLPPDLLGSGRWDGTFRNKNVDAGVYVCVIEVTFIDGISEIRKQDITLLR